MPEIKVTYSWYHIPTQKTGTHHAYFPSALAALKLLAGWQTEHWRYSPTKIERSDGGEWHPECHIRSDLNTI